MVYLICIYKDNGGTVLRIVSGEKRGLKLKDIPKEATCRPTLDRVKEAMFDIIRFDISGKVLDLFSGTGQLGIEAVSNGCEIGRAHV